MKVLLDTELCQGYGLCVLAAPEVFDIADADDVVTIIQTEPSEALRESLEEAVASCPVVALAIKD